MKIQAVIFDWAGTMIDYGCNAPPAVLRQIFAARGVELLPAESRHAMGLLKRDQIREICRLERVLQAWTAAHGSPATEADVEQLFTDFVPLQIARIREFSRVVDGAAEVVASLRASGIRVGSTSGYTRAMLEPI